jgi:hypothetical protein
MKMGTAIFASATQLPVGTGPFKVRVEKDRRIQRASECLWRGWELSIEIGWVEGQARAKEHLSQVFGERGQLDRAVEAARESLTLYRSFRSQANITMMEHRIEELDRIITKGRAIDVFIAMTIDNLHPLSAGYHATVIGVCESFSLRAARVDDITNATRIVDRILMLIESVQFLICDLSNERPNVYYEAGWAHGIKKNVILTARRDSLVHFDLKDYDILFYDSMTDLARELAERIRTIVTS